MTACCGSHVWWVVLLLISVERVVLSKSEDSSDSNKLVWYNITRPFTRGALCNDFTPAGYFIRKTQGQRGDGTFNGDGLKNGQEKSQKWVIFLEGGGACNTPSSCNNRYIDLSIRNKFRNFRNGVVNEDIGTIWEKYKNKAAVVSKLMTSLWKWNKNEGSYESTSNLWSIEGRDLLSPSEADNPDFYDHNHVLIPYCSSDLWLKQTGNFRHALSKNFSFQFCPNASDHQFTFRGAAIFRSVIEDLYSYHEFNHASEVLLAGSGVGGLGALNHAHWLNDQLKYRQHTGTSARLFVLLDSAWFVDFNEAISNEYSTAQLIDQIARDELLETCSPVSMDELDISSSGDLGYDYTYDPDNQTFFTIPCLSVQGVLELGRFPEDVPVLAIFGSYNIYYLLKALTSIIQPEEVS